MNMHNIFKSIANFSLSGVYHRVRYHPWKRSARFLGQRLTRGWDDGETFSLDYSLAKLIAPRLRRFTEVTCGYPIEMTMEEWQGILAKMTAAFEFAASEDRWLAKPEDFQKHQEGIDLFAEHFFGLWW